MGNVVHMKRYKEAWMTGQAHCLCCHHNWEATVPVGTAWFKCPECTSDKGHLLGVVMPEGRALVSCDCGAQALLITDEKEVFCANCGTYHNMFGDD